MGKRRKFAKEFKLSVIRQLDVKPVAEICREYDLHENLIYRWRKEYNSNPQEAFKGYGKAWKESAKIAQYERLIARLYAENDLLKKSIEKLTELRAEEKNRRLSIK